MSLSLLHHRNVNLLNRSHNIVRVQRNYTLQTFIASSSRRGILKNERNRILYEHIACVPMN